MSGVDVCVSRYLNRLSDFLFVAARWVADGAEVVYKSRSAQDSGEVETRVNDNTGVNEK